jgi:hypothetical protein
VACFISFLENHREQQLRSFHEFFIANCPCATAVNIAWESFGSFVEGCAQMKCVARDAWRFPKQRKYFHRTTPPKNTPGIGASPLFHQSTVLITTTSFISFKIFLDSC